MKNFITDLSQRQAVTVLRFLFPIWAIIGIFSLKYVPSTLIVFEDAALTAGNIIGNQLLFSLGIVGSLVTQLIQIVAVLALYKLFKAVNKDHALLLVIFGLAGIPIAMLNTLNLVAVLMFASGASYLSVFDPTQLQALMMFFLNLNEQGIMIASVFWGLWLFPYGYLVYKSGYFPKIFGTLVIIGGFGYFLAFFAHFLLPEQKTLYTVLETATIGETLFMLWLIIRGAKLPEVKN